MSKLRSKISSSKGVATIEFAIGFVFFWYMCAAWVEMSFMSYVSAVGDLAISRAAQVAKKSEGNATEFLMTFQDVLDESDSLWKYVTDSNSFTAAITYLSSFEQLASYNQECKPKNNELAVECGDAPEGSAIAIYRINYNYKPLFNIFIDSENVFSREMIVVQEYQRDKFVI